MAPEVRRLPGSLVNIFREYGDDLGYPTPSNGDLSPWTERGVMLLNRVLTVQPGKPASHRGKGWEEVTEQAIRALAARQAPLVAILWGRDARSLVPLLGERPVHRVGAPEPELGRPRLLRLAAVQPGQPAAGEPGRGTRRLEAAVVPEESCYSPNSGYRVPCIRHLRLPGIGSCRTACSSESPVSACCVPVPPPRQCRPAPN